MRRSLAALPLLATHWLTACGGGAVCGQGQIEPGPDDELGAFLYQHDTVLDLQIFMDAEALAGLPEASREQVDDVHATMVFEGREWAVGLRLKGNSSFRKIDKKAAFKIDFGEFEADNTFYGVRRLTLNNMVQDESMLSENLAYWLHAAVGGVAPRQGYACVRVNGDDYGLYGLVETMDEQFVQRHFDDPSGVLYEGGKGADIRQGRQELFEIEDAGVPEGRGDIVALTEALDAATPETFMDVMGDHFVLDDLLRTWAVELYAGNIDSYITRSNNFLLYHQPDPNNWTMIPWDEDQAFQDDLDPYDPYDPEVLAEHGRLFEDCLVSDGCVEALVEHIEEVILLAEDEGLLEHAIEQRAMISNLSRSDPRSDCSSHCARSAQREVLSFIRRRPDGIRQRIEAGR